MTSRKRKLDVRRVRASRCYTALEVAELLGVALGTVRAWIRSGLPCLSDARPFLIPGDELKAWLNKRRAKNRQKCLPNQMYCLGCRAPREPSAESVCIALRNAKTTTATGCCPVCGSTMNRAGSAAKIEDSRRAFGLHTTGETNLAGSIDPIVNHHFEKEAAE